MRQVLQISLLFLSTLGSQAYAGNIVLAPENFLVSTDNMPVIGTCNIAKEQIKELLGRERASHPEIVECEEPSFSVVESSSTLDRVPRGTPYVTSCIVSARQTCYDNVRSERDSQHVFNRSSRNISRGAYIFASKRATRRAVESAKQIAISACYQAGYSNCEVIGESSRFRRGGARPNVQGGTFGASCRAWVSILGRNE